MASNEKLEDLVEEGIMRKDFYFRISGIKLELPPLRERSEDIPKLTDYFIEKYSGILEHKYTLQQGLIDELMAYQWMGNVRELENSIKGAMIYSNEGILKKEHFPNLSLNPFSGKEQSSYEHLNDLKYEDALEEFRKTYFTSLWEKARQVSSTAAKMSGMTQQGLRKILKKYNLID
jgi:arginine utilization regulatory protein